MPILAPTEEQIHTNIIMEIVLGTHLQKYIESKVLSEKELLSYNDGKSPAFEVVTLPLVCRASDHSMLFNCSSFYSSTCTKRSKTTHK